MRKCKRAGILLAGRCWALGSFVCGLALLFQLGQGRAVARSDVWDESDARLTWDGQALILRDDFQGGNSGWTASQGDAGAIVWSDAGEYLSLSNTHASVHFPLVGRNDVFDAVSGYWRLGVRFRYPQLTGYGSTIAAGTAAFNVSRSVGLRPEREDVLRITQRSGADHFVVGAFGSDHYVGADSTAWHVVELVVSGPAYVLYLDGEVVGSGVPSGFPRSLWFGNYTTQDPGDWSDIMVDWVEVSSDLEAPLTTLAFSGTTPGDAGWWRSSVEGVLLAEDAWSGVATLQYRLDDGSWVDYDAPIVVAADGVHVVQYRSIDHAGNGTSLDPELVRIDTISPSVSIDSLEDAQWISGTVVVGGTALDDTSGVARVGYSTDYAGWQMGIGEESAGVFVWSAAWDTRGGTDGEHDVCTVAWDVAGNRTLPFCMPVNVDNTAPTTTVLLSGTEGDGNWYRSPVDVTLLASDGPGVGVSSTVFRVNGEAWRSFAAPFTVSGEGGQGIEYSSTDSLGNVAVAQKLTIPIDSVPPATVAHVTGTLGLNGWYTDSIALALTASDMTSGVERTCLDGLVYRGPVSLVKDGRYNPTFYSGDVAGNLEKATFLSLNLDTSPPVVHVDGGKVCPRCGHTLKLKVRASDATSGILDWRLDLWNGTTTVVSWTGTTLPESIPWDGRGLDGSFVRDGAYTVRFVARDVAGWSAVAWDQVKVRPRSPVAVPTRPPQPPVVTMQPVQPTVPDSTAIVTPLPTMCPLPTWTFLPGSTLSPSVEPALTAVLPVATPAAVSEARPAVTLRVGVFQDDDADAVQGQTEDGLAGLRVDISNDSGWRVTAISDAQGVVTVTLPRAGVYVVSLYKSSVGAWFATTRTPVLLSVDVGGTVTILPDRFNRQIVGSAPGCALAFGLTTRVAQRMTLWLPMSVVGLLLVTSITAILDRRASAIYAFTIVIGGGYDVAD